MSSVIVAQHLHNTFMLQPINIGWSAAYQLYAGVSRGEEGSLARYSQLIRRIISKGFLDLLKTFNALHQAIQQNIHGYRSISPISTMICVIPSLQISYAYFSTAQST